MISSLNKTQERGALGVFADFQGLPGITGLQGSKGGVGLEARRLRSSINQNKLVTVQQKTQTCGTNKYYSVAVAEHKWIF